MTTSSPWLKEAKQGKSNPLPFHPWPMKRLIWSWFLVSFVTLWIRKTGQLLGRKHTLKGQPWFSSTYATSFELTTAGLKRGEGPLNGFCTRKLSMWYVNRPNSKRNFIQTTDLDRWMKRKKLSRSSARSFQNPSLDTRGRYSGRTLWRAFGRTCPGPAFQHG
jgi:hypothetical protein